MEDKLKRKEVFMNEELYPALLDYIWDYSPNKHMNDNEKKAWRHQLAFDRIKHGNKTGFHKYRFEEEHISTDENVLQLLSKGYDNYKIGVATRIFNEHRSELNLNLCPKCSKIARTPWAQQCRFCLNDWH